MSRATDSMRKGIQLLGACEEGDTQKSNTNKAKKLDTKAVRELSLIILRLYQVSCCSITTKIHIESAVNWHLVDRFLFKLMGVVLYN